MFGCGKKKEGVKKVDIGGGVVVARVGVEYETGEITCERIFRVGEVVECWTGAFVRGRRLGSGEPAIVKRVEGKGVYAIKMVGSSRGKFRLVGWESFFKDASFNKNVAMVDGPRVRGRGRLEERAKVEAEAQFAVQLRQTKRMLLNAECEMKKKETEAEERLKMHEKETRQADKEKRNEHKRTLDKMEAERTADIEVITEDLEVQIRNGRHLI